MAKTKKNESFFIYTFPLKVNGEIAKELERRFKMAQDIYHTTLREILKRTRKMKKDPRYKKAYQLDKGAERNEILKELDADYDLVGKFTFTKFANKYRNDRNYHGYIPSDVAIKLGSRAWDAYSKVKFAKGAKRINLHNDLLSFEGKSDSGLSIRNKMFKMGRRSKQLLIPVVYKNDPYERNVLTHTVKYSRLVRKMIRGQYKYYVQQIFVGTPPIKEKHMSNLTGPVGINVGIPKIALSSHYQTDLRELAPISNRKQIEAKIRRLSRKLDRQRRANNPDNYNPDGTVKRGSKKWIYSKNYLKTKAELAEIHRVLRENRKLSHKALANEILTMGDEFIIKDMTYKDLQMRTENGSKRQHGKPILDHAPSQLLQEIKNKATYQGKLVREANTAKVKVYQLDHTDGTYLEEPLHQDNRKIADHVVQRDLYAAFLLEHTKLDNETIDLENCQHDFETFLRNQDLTLSTIDPSLLAIDKDGYNPEN